MLGFVVGIIITWTRVEMVARSNNPVNRANECRQCQRFHLNSEQNVVMAATNSILHIRIGLRHDKTYTFFVVVLILTLRFCLHFVWLWSDSFFTEDFPYNLVVINIDFKILSRLANLQSDRNRERNKWKTKTKKNSYTERTQLHQGQKKLRHQNLRAFYVNRRIPVLRNPQMA